MKREITATIIENEPLARYTAWRIGGPARWFGVAASADELAGLVAWGRERELPVFVIGGGSNVLVADGGYHGLVIRNRAAAQRVDEREGEVVLWTEAGAPTAGTARRLAAQGFGGLLWAEGLPGTIGGAVYGNAGCYGGDMAQQLLRAWVWRDGEIEEWPVERFAYGYRTSALKALTPRSAPPVVLAAELRLDRGDPQQLRAQMAAIAELRKGKTPAGSSCGSVFKNPPGTTAGTLLDQAGLKGAEAGGAIVSHKHANYIVNRGDATAADVLRLADVMRERVLTAFGVSLELEVQLVGEQP